MLNDYLGRLILSFVNNYFENIDSNLSLGLLTGVVSLKNLRLKRDVLQRVFDVSPALRLRTGSVEEVHLRVPWHSLKASPCTCALTNVLIELEYDPVQHHQQLGVSPHVRDQQGVGASSPSALSTGLEGKLGNPTNTNAAGGDSESSFFSEMIRKMIVNATLTINGLTVRFIEKDNLAATLRVETFTTFSAVCSKRWDLDSVMQSVWCPGYADPIGMWQLVHREFLIRGMTMHLATLKGGGTSNAKFEQTASTTSRQVPQLDRSCPPFLAPIDIRLRARCYLTCIGSVTTIPFLGGTNAGALCSCTDTPHLNMDVLENEFLSHEQELEGLGQAEGTEDAEGVKPMCGPMLMLSVSTSGPFIFSVTSDQFRAIRNSPGIAMLLRTKRVSNPPEAVACSEPDQSVVEHPPLHRPHHSGVEEALESADNNADSSSVPQEQSTTGWFSWVGNMFSPRGSATPRSSATLIGSTNPQTKKDETESKLLLSKDVEAKILAYAPVHAASLSFVCGGAHLYYYSVDDSRSWNSQSTSNDYGPTSSTSHERASVPADFIDRSSLETQSRTSLARYNAYIRGQVRSSKSDRGTLSKNPFDSDVEAQDESLPNSTLRPDERPNDGTKVPAYNATLGPQGEEPEHRKLLRALIDEMSAHTFHAARAIDKFSTPVVDYLLEYLLARPDDVTGHSRSPMTHNTYVLLFGAKLSMFSLTALVPLGGRPFHDRHSNVLPLAIRIPNAPPSLLGGYDVLAIPQTLHASGRDDALNLQPKPASILAIGIVAFVDYTRRSPCFITCVGPRCVVDRLLKCAHGMPVSTRPSDPSHASAHHNESLRDCPHQSATGTEYMVNLDSIGVSSTYGSAQAALLKHPHIETDEGASGHRPVITNASRLPSLSGFSLFPTHPFHLECDGTSNVFPAGGSSNPMDRDVSVNGILRLASAPSLERLWLCLTQAEIAYRQEILGEFFQTPGSHSASARAAFEWPLNVALQAHNERIAQAAGDPRSSSKPRFQASHFIPSVSLRRSDLGIDKLLPNAFSSAIFVTQTNHSITVKLASLQDVPHQRAGFDKESTPNLTPSSLFGTPALPPWHVTPSHIANMIDRWFHQTTQSFSPDFVPSSSSAVRSDTGSGGSLASGSSHTHLINKLYQESGLGPFGPDKLQFLESPHAKETVEAVHSITRASVIAVFCNFDVRSTLFQTLFQIASDFQLGSDEQDAKGQPESTAVASSRLPFDMGFELFVETIHVCAPLASCSDDSLSFAMRLQADYIQLSVGSALRARSLMLDDKMSMYSFSDMQLMTIHSFTDEVSSNPPVQGSTPTTSTPSSHRGKLHRRDTLSLGRLVIEPVLLYEESESLAPCDPRITRSGTGFLTLDDMHDFLQILSKRQSRLGDTEATSTLGRSQGINDPRFALASALAHAAVSATYPGTFVKERGQHQIVASRDDIAPTLPFDWTLIQDTGSRRATYARGSSLGSVLLKLGAIDGRTPFTVLQFGSSQTLSLLSTVAFEEDGKWCKDALKLSGLQFFVPNDSTSSGSFGIDCEGLTITLVSPLFISKQEPNHPVAERANPHTPLKRHNRHPTLAQTVIAVSLNRFATFLSMRELVGLTSALTSHLSGCALPAVPWQSGQSSLSQPIHFQLCGSRIIMRSRDPHWREHDVHPHRHHHPIFLPAWEVLGQELDFSRSFVLADGIDFSVPPGGPRFDLMVDVGSSRIYIDRRFDVEIPGLSGSISCDLDSVISIKTTLMVPKIESYVATESLGVVLDDVSKFLQFLDNFRTSIQPQEPKFDCVPNEPRSVDDSLPVSKFLQRCYVSVDYYISSAILHCGLPDRTTASAGGIKAKASPSNLSLLPYNSGTGAKIIIQGPGISISCRYRPNSNGSPSLDGQHETLVCEVAPPHVSYALGAAIVPIVLFTKPISVLAYLGPYGMSSVLDDVVVVQDSLEPLDLSSYATQVQDVNTLDIRVHLPCPLIKVDPMAARLLTSLLKVLDGLSRERPASKQTSSSNPSPSVFWASPSYIVALTFKCQSNGSEVRGLYPDGIRLAERSGEDPGVELALNLTTCDAKLVYTGGAKGCGLRVVRKNPKGPFGPALGALLNVNLGEFGAEIHGLGREDPVTILRYTGGTFSMGCLHGELRSLSIIVGELSLNAHLAPLVRLAEGYRGSVTQPPRTNEILSGTLESQVTEQELAVHTAIPRFVSCFNLDVQKVVLFLPCSESLPYPKGLSIEFTNIACGSLHADIVESATSPPHQLPDLAPAEAMSPSANSQLSTSIPGSLTSSSLYVSSSDSGAYAPSPKAETVGLDAGHLLATATIAINWNAGETIKPVLESPMVVSVYQKALDTTPCYSVTVENATTPKVMLAIADSKRYATLRDLLKLKDDVTTTNAALIEAISQLRSSHLSQDTPKQQKGDSPVIPLIAVPVTKPQVSELCSDMDTSSTTTSNLNDSAASFRAQLRLDRLVCTSNDVKQSSPDPKSMHLNIRRLRLECVNPMGFQILLDDSINPHESSSLYLQIGECKAILHACLFNPFALDKDSTAALLCGESFRLGVECVHVTLGPWQLLQQTTSEIMPTALVTVPTQQLALKLQSRDLWNESRSDYDFVDRLLDPLSWISVNATVAEEIRVEVSASQLCALQTMIGRVVALSPVRSTDPVSTSEPQLTPSQSNLDLAQYWLPELSSLAPDATSSLRLPWFGLTGQAKPVYSVDLSFDKIRLRYGTELGVGQITINNMNVHASTSPPVLFASQTPRGASRADAHSRHSKVNEIAEVYEVSLAEVSLGRIAIEPSEAHQSRGGAGSCPILFDHAGIKATVRSTAMWKCRATNEPSSERSKTARTLIPLSTVPVRTFKISLSSPSQEGPVDIGIHPKQIELISSIVKDLMARFGSEAEVVEPTMGNQASTAKTHIFSPPSLEEAEKQNTCEIVDCTSVDKLGQWLLETIHRANRPQTSMAKVADVMPVQVHLPSVPPPIVIASNQDSVLTSVQVPQWFDVVFEHPRTLVAFGIGAEMSIPDLPIAEVVLPFLTSEDANHLTQFPKPYAKLQNDGSITIRSWWLITIWVHSDDGLADSPARTTTESAAGWIPVWHIIHCWTHSKRSSDSTGRAASISDASVKPKVFRLDPTYGSKQANPNSSHSSQGVWKDSIAAANALASRLWRITWHPLDDIDPRLTSCNKAAQCLVSAGRGHMSAGLKCSENDQGCTCDTLLARRVQLSPMPFSQPVLVTVDILAWKERGVPETLIADGIMLGYSPQLHGAGNRGLFNYFTAAHPDDASAETKPKDPVHMARPVLSPLCMARRIALHSRSHCMPAPHVQVSLALPEGVRLHLLQGKLQSQSSGHISTRVTRLDALQRHSILRVQLGPTFASMTVSLRTKFGLHRAANLLPIDVECALQPLSNTLPRPSLRADVAADLRNEIYHTASILHEVVSIDDLLSYVPPPTEAEGNQVQYSEPLLGNHIFNVIHVVREDQKEMALPAIPPAVAPKLLWPKLLAVGTCQRTTDTSPVLPGVALAPSILFSTSLGVWVPDFSRYDEADIAPTSSRNEGKFVARPFIALLLPTRVAVVARAAIDPSVPMFANELWSSNPLSPLASFAMLFDASVGAKVPDLYLRTSPILLDLSRDTLHPVCNALAQLTRNDLQSEPANEEDIPAPFQIRNLTGIPLYIQQVGTDQMILLSPRSVTPYAVRVRKIAVTPVADEANAAPNLSVLCSALAGHSPDCSRFADALRRVVSTRQYPEAADLDTVKESFIDTLPPLSVPHAGSLLAWPASQELFLDPDRFVPWSVTFAAAVDDAVDSPDKLVWSKPVQIMAPSPHATDAIVELLSQLSGESRIATSPGLTREDKKLASALQDANRRYKTRRNSGDEVKSTALEAKLATEGTDLSNPTIAIADEVARLSWDMFITTSLRAAMSSLGGFASFAAAFDDDFLPTLPLSSPRHPCIEFQTLSTRSAKRLAPEFGKFGRMVITPDKVTLVNRGRTDGEGSLQLPIPGRVQGESSSNASREGVLVGSEGLLGGVKAGGAAVDACLRAVRIYRPQGSGDQGKSRQYMDILILSRRIGSQTEITLLPAAQVYVQPSETCMSHRSLIGHSQLSSPSMSSIPLIAWNFDSNPQNERHRDTHELIQSARAKIEEIRLEATPLTERNDGIVSVTTMSKAFDLPSDYKDASEFHEILAGSSELIACMAELGITLAFSSQTIVDVHDLQPLRYVLRTGRKSVNRFIDFIPPHRAALLGVDSVKEVENRLYPFFDIIKESDIPLEDSSVSVVDLLLSRVQVTFFHRQRHTMSPTQSTIDTVRPEAQSVSLNAVGAAPIRLPVEVFSKVHHLDIDSNTASMLIARLQQLQDSLHRSVPMVQGEEVDNKTALAEPSLLYPVMNVSSTGRFKLPSWLFRLGRSTFLKLLCPAPSTLLIPPGFSKYLLPSFRIQLEASISMTSMLCLPLSLNVPHVASNFAPPNENGALDSQVLKTYEIPPQTSLQLPGMSASDILTRDIEFAVRLSPTSRPLDSGSPMRLETPTVNVLDTLRAYLHHATREAARSLNPQSARRAQITAAEENQAQRLAALSWLERNWAEPVNAPVPYAFSFTLFAMETRGDAKTDEEQHSQDGLPFAWACPMRISAEIIALPSNQKVISTDLKSYPTVAEAIEAVCQMAHRCACFLRFQISPLIEIENRITEFGALMVPLLTAELLTLHPQFAAVSLAEEMSKRIEPESTRRTRIVLADFIEQINAHVMEQVLREPGKFVFAQSGRVSQVNLLPVPTRLPTLQPTYQLSTGPHSSKASEQMTRSSWFGSWLTHTPNQPTLQSQPELKWEVHFVDASSHRLYAHTISWKLAIQAAHMPSPDKFAEYDPGCSPLTQLQPAVIPLDPAVPQFDHGLALTQRGLPPYLFTRISSAYLPSALDACARMSRAELATPKPNDELVCHYHLGAPGSKRDLPPRLFPGAPLGSYLPLGGSPYYAMTTPLALLVPTKTAGHYKWYNTHAYRIQVASTEISSHSRSARVVLQRVRRLSPGPLASSPAFYRELRQTLDSGGVMPGATHSPLSDRSEPPISEVVVDGDIRPSSDQHLPIMATESVANSLDLIAPVSHAFAALFNASYRALLQRYVTHTPHDPQDPVAALAPVSLEYHAEYDYLTPLLHLANSVPAYACGYTVPVKRSCAGDSSAYVPLGEMHRTTRVRALGLPELNSMVFVNATSLHVQFAPIGSALAGLHREFSPVLELAPRLAHEVFFSAWSTSSFADLPKRPADAKGLTSIKTPLGYVSLPPMVNPDVMQTVGTRLGSAEFWDNVVGLTTLLRIGARFQEWFFIRVPGYMPSERIPVPTADDIVSASADERISSFNLCLNENHYPEDIEAAIEIVTRERKMLEEESNPLGLQLMTKAKEINRAVGLPIRIVLRKAEDANSRSSNSLPATLHLTLQFVASGSTLLALVTADSDSPAGVQALVEDAIATERLMGENASILHHAAPQALDSLEPPLVSLARKSLNLTAVSALSRNHGGRNETTLQLGAVFQVPEVVIRFYDTRWRGVQQRLSEEAQRRRQQLESVISAGTPRVYSFPVSKLRALSGSGMPMSTPIMELRVENLCGEIALDKPTILRVKHPEPLCRLSDLSSKVVHDDTSIIRLPSETSREVARVVLGKFSPFETSNVTKFAAVSFPMFRPVGVVNWSSLVGSSRCRNDPRLTTASSSMGRGPERGRARSVSTSEYVPLNSMSTAPTRASSKSKPLALPFVEDESSWRKLWETMWPATALHWAPLGDAGGNTIRLGAPVSHGDLQRSTHLEVRRLDTPLARVCKSASRLRTRLSTGSITIAFGDALALEDGQSRCDPLVDVACLRCRAVSSLRSLLSSPADTDRVSAVSRHIQELEHARARAAESSVRVFPMLRIAAKELNITSKGESAYEAYDPALVHPLGTSLLAVEAFANLRSHPGYERNDLDLFAFQFSHYESHLDELGILPDTMMSSRRRAPIHSIIPAFDLDVLWTPPLEYHETIRPWSAPYTPWTAISTYIGCMPIQLELQEGPLFLASSMLLPLLDDFLRHLALAQNITPDPPVEMMHPSDILNRIAFNHVHVSAIHARITASFTVVTSAKMGVPTPIRLKAAPLHIGSFDLSPTLFAYPVAVSEFFQTLVLTIIEHVLQPNRLIGALPALAGSTEMLGNPTRLAESVWRGVREIWLTPTYVTHRGGTQLEAATLGLVRGVVAFLAHAADGTFASIAGVSSAMAESASQVEKSNRERFDSGLTAAEHDMAETPTSPGAKSRMLIHLFFDSDDLASRDDTENSSNGDIALRSAVLDRDLDEVEEFDEVDGHSRARSASQSILRRQSVEAVPFISPFSRPVHEQRSTSQSSTSPQSSATVLAGQTTPIVSRASRSASQSRWTALGHVVSAPIQGYRAFGTYGFLQGLGSSTVSALTLPVARTLGIIASVTDTLAHLANSTAYVLGSGTGMPQGFERSFAPDAPRLIQSDLRQRFAAAAGLNLSLANLNFLAHQFAAPRYSLRAIAAATGVRLLPLLTIENEAKLVQIIHVVTDYYGPLGLVCELNSKLMATAEEKMRHACDEAFENNVESQVRLAEDLEQAARSEYGSE